MFKNKHDEFNFIIIININILIMKVKIITKILNNNLINNLCKNDNVNIKNYYD